MATEQVGLQFSQCSNTRRVKLNDELWEKKRVRWLKKLLKGKKHTKQEPKKDKRRDENTAILKLVPA